MVNNHITAQQHSLNIILTFHIEIELIIQKR